MRLLSETLIDLIGFAEQTITRPATHYGFAVDIRLAAIATEVRRADAMPAEGIRTTRLALAMVIFLEEFFNGDRSATSRMVGHAGNLLPDLRQEAWTARDNEKEARGS
jgi:hypothetical protein